MYNWENNWDDGSASITTFNQEVVADGNIQIETKEPWAIRDISAHVYLKTCSLLKAKGTTNSMNPH